MMEHYTLVPQGSIETKETSAQIYAILLQKCFLGAGNNAFVGAGAIPASSFRSYKCYFQGWVTGAPIFFSATNMLAILFF